MKLLAKPGHRICWFYLAILLSAAGSAAGTIKHSDSIFHTKVRS